MLSTREKMNYNNDFSKKLISHELTKAHFVHFSICTNHVFAI